jgi:hypothetical protein
MTTRERIEHAIDIGRFDLAAHLIVLAAARAVTDGYVDDGCKKEKKLLLEALG